MYLYLSLRFIEVRMAHKIYTKQPLGKLLSNTGRTLLNNLKLKLNHLDIKRNFYALILIEEGKGMLTQQDLADLLNSDKVSIVRIIDYLSGRGYVKRVRDFNDRRKYKLTLTSKAETELPLIKKEITEVTKKALKGITAEKIEELYENLDVINSNLN